MRPVRHHQRPTLVGVVDEDILAFTAGKDPVLDLHLAEADCLGTAAHVTMLAGVRVRPPVLTDHEKEKVISELVRIIRAVRNGQFRIRTEDQDVHLAVERRLTARLGPLGRKVHTGRSRNDQVATDLRLYGKQQLLGVRREIADLALTLLRWARRYARVPMVGRTHLQPAMPGSVGLWASAFAEGLLDDLIPVEAAYDFNDRCPLGAAAGYGVPLPINRRLTARLLGFRGPVHTVLHAVNSRGQAEAVILAALGQVMITLSRLAQDLVIFTMPEFGYFTMPEGYSTGSSIMPQKRNPDAMELIRARAARVLADAWAAAEIVRALPAGYQRDLQEIKEPFLNGLATTRSCLRVTRRVMEGLRVNAARLRAGFTPEVFAAHRALELTAGGVPFRDAYRQVKAGAPAGLPPGWEAAVFKPWHLGAAGRLEESALTARARAARSASQREEKRFHRAISRLLGLAYPSLARPAGRTGRQP